MKKKLFLEGNLGIGKSSLIRETLLPFLPAVGGFFVQRIFIGERYAAFRFNEVAGRAAYELNRYVSNLDEVDNLFLFSDARGKWHQDLQVFARQGSTCLQKGGALGKKLILLDELGGIELACQGFMKEVWGVLDGDKPALGVLKSWQNVRKLKTGLPDSGDPNENSTALLSRMRNHAQVELLSVTEKNYQEVRTRVKEFVEGVLK